MWLYKLIASAGRVWRKYRTAWFSLGLIWQKYIASVWDPTGNIFGGEVFKLTIVVRGNYNDKLYLNWCGVGKNSLEVVTPLSSVEASLNWLYKQTSLILLSPRNIL